MSGTNNGAMRIAKWYMPPAPDISKQDAMAHRIELLARQEDFEVCMLGSMGLGYEAICARTGLSEGQVSLRLKKAGIKLSDYRTGKSLFAQVVCESVGKKAATLLTTRVREIQSHVTEV